jgi:hypothetical protein
MSWLIRAHAGGRLVGGAGDDTCRVDDVRHDGAASVVPARVPAQDIPLGALPLPNAGRLRLHLRHHLVGDRAQLHGVLCRRTRELPWFHLVCMKHVRELY